ncbi:hypothetical protein SAMN05216223_102108 [Actinacidiphila yanglinensis]|uniref:Thoeris protein ThsA Macro domain-containing protein n=1 Tax=Actinacidiphila yanglinensis TaxID=310779 RepID=A0A1H5V1S8_9ACTN|nr:macro domain-containing protein [Actinacidiphila yanglinensis]SEF81174.1 hypothetical protein SAMN05216223_102108 [Actinacidiphila yanglinensis]
MFLRNTMAAFGGISAAVQFFDQLFPRDFPDPGAVTLASVALGVAWGAVRARTKSVVRQEFRHPAMTVVVQAGDLFEQPGHLVVGFSDTFDTAEGGGLLINDTSVQGQLLARRYGGDVQRLDGELSTALAAVAPSAREAPERKPLGKLDRYPVGTVAVLGARPRFVFASAYSRIGNDYVASSSVEEFWYSLNRLWDAVHRHAQRECVAMPLIGSGLSRLDYLDEESLLRLILLSFVAHSRERAICRELRVVLRPADLARINVPEVEAFLATLASGLGGT